MVGNNSKHNKVHNRALILKIVQQSQSITRADIAKLTGLTRAGITTITSSLIEDRLIKEDADHSINKKSVPLVINNEIHRTIAISLGRFATVGALFNVGGDILFSEEIPHMEDGLNRYEIIDHIILLVKNILKTCQLDIKNVLGIGIAGPGPINQQNLEVSLSNETSELPPYRWGEYNIKDALEQNFNLPVYLENNCNLSALGERWYGAGRGINNFTTYTIGMGIGAGTVMNGEMQNGQGDVFSEVGHITIDMNGPECSCGNRGCLELYGSFKSLVANYFKTMGYDPRDKTDFQYIHQIENIFKKAREGDSVCLDLIRKHASVLGFGAVSLANMFSPDRIIVSPNEIGETNIDLLIPVLQEIVQKRTFKVIANKVQVILSPLGNKGDLYGGAALVLENRLIHGLE